MPAEGVIPAPFTATTRIWPAGGMGPAQELADAAALPALLHVAPASELVSMLKKLARSPEPAQSTPTLRAVRTRAFCRMGAPGGIVALSAATLRTVPPISAPGERSEVATDKV